ncbi:PREDICTED: uncharacterized protein LOC109586463 [Amphimedon queenslandica]|uniref:HECT domain-containing protein n=1 Tax=Amphimedon queenslandica TaxID=400682 RepID=A0A1X7TR41_AMPQE|nr:PREDICTED: uncharacterized protein LOC109586463 [Amphimedon queenslandica]|eukprot:XP_019858212.1 PREDICTED: uncharacterized protein LOC109586463 [Amphimedon queenslandica]
MEGHGTREGRGRSATSQDNQVTAVDALAGALVNVVRQSLRSGMEPSTSQEATRPVTEFQRAAKRPKLSPPSLFNSRQVHPYQSRKRKETARSTPKVTNYVRDIILLPDEFENETGSVCIPRSNNREMLGKAGLVGKIELSSDKTEDEVRTEICELFAVPMGLTTDNIKDGIRFKFHYLQRAGCNTRSLCKPTVKDTFQWNGKQVASLAKSGSFIYLLAAEHLPGWTRFAEKDEMVNEEAHEMIDSDSDDLPRLPESFFSTHSSPSQRSNDHDIIIIGSTPASAPQTPSTDHPAFDATDTSSPQPYTIESSVSCELGTSSSGSNSTVADLVAMFDGVLTEQQVAVIYQFSGCNRISASSCLLEGPLLSSIINMCKQYFSGLPTKKLFVDSESYWEDMVAEYKGQANSFFKLRISIVNQPAIDTGGVRRQIYTSVFESFASNKYIHLFDGPLNYLRPSCSAEAKLSGLLKVLGSMISHSFCQDGLGFPYLSPLCYWYIVGGEEKALEYSSVDDIPADAAQVITLMNQCVCNEDLSNLMSNEVVQDVFQRCSITQVLKMSNKDVIAQCIITYEAVERISKSLDQLCEGLSNLGLSDVIRAFPHLFLSIFVFSGTVTSQDVIDAVYMPDPVNKTILAHLKRYIVSLSEDELKMFLVHATGSTYPINRSIRVEVNEDNRFSCHTCAKMLSVPQSYDDSEDGYLQFSENFSAVITDTSFNTV